MQKLRQVWKEDGGQNRNGKEEVPMGSFSRSGNSRLLLRGFHEPVVLLGADAVLGKCAPLNAGRAHGPCIDVPALLTGRIRLVGPDLHLFSAFLAPDLFRLWSAYL